jgi:hypothetical protein
MKKREWMHAASVLALALAAQTGLAQTPPNETTFKLVPNPKFLECLRGSSEAEPSARVVVERGELNDTLILTIENIKPNLGFDLFTVQRSPFLANGAPDPDFKGSFGLAWYQSDVQADEKGQGTVTIRTILLDQIFGFDPDVKLAPTNTFHVGFWFNDPEDARACGFDVTKPTPFNGEHRAGPLAMISLPNEETKLGPLCTNPDFSTNPVSCHP